MCLSARARFVVVDAAQQTLSYYGNDPKMTLVEYGITEAPKGTVLYHTIPCRAVALHTCLTPFSSTTGVFNMKHGAVTKLDVAKGRPTEFAFELKAAGRSTLFCCK